MNRGNRLNKLLICHLVITLRRHLGLLDLCLKADFSCVDKRIHVLVQSLVTELLKLKTIVIVANETLGFNLCSQLFHGLLVGFIHLEECILDVIDGTLDNLIHLLVQITFQLLVCLEPLVESLGQVGHLLVNRLQLVSHFLLT